MKKIYYVWKDPKCNGVNPEWIEMSGKEFYIFRNLPENKKRLFVKEVDDDNNKCCMFFEANEEKYIKYNREHSRNMRNKERKRKYSFKTVSMDEMTNEDGDCSLHDIIPDENIKNEEDILISIQIEELKSSLSILSQRELEIIKLVFFENIENCSLRKIAREKGIPHKTLDDRLKKIKEKLKKNSAQNK